MKNLSRFFVGAASLVLLTACGPSKVSYATFHEKAVAAVEKAPEYKKVTAKGSVTAASVELKLDCVFEKKDSGWELTKGDAISGSAAAVYLSMTADLVGEEEDTTYYAGNGFKITTNNEDGKGSITWNASGYITAIKVDAKDSGNMNVKFSWSK